MIPSSSCRFSQRRTSSGWTLVELLVVIGIIGLLIAFMAPRLVGRLLTQARVAATRQEMQELKVALVGDPTLVSDGEMISVGYHGDVGSWPPPFPEDSIGLHWLSTKPPAIPAWDPYTKHGWHGPYINIGTDSLSRDITEDAWTNPYKFIRDAHGNPIGLESAGADGLFEGESGDAGDDIKVMF